ncbi:putative protein OS=Tsukamurella paurometabola (strain ATCC 8368 / DSM / CCUG 35730 /CIP 100753 / JCM 10117 / KCTC 9821 / NBRC 16120 / NCIMB 702349/ NCTC 13040) OX=521096 GN=Tpau_0412 PE=4 SV=1 [Tsukamurella paurometabola]|uniref:Uncharacterized protein n=2 Tax=Tsukamurella paurometabola TaxID=2061 RepID=D5URK0_TSUPD|nr:hypothetical protein Tpau_0412 [Tsukamurella paurometabola DSM 20162]SUP42610.1 Uncharacterised protein [Tsukamurella paurometabola]
MGPPPNRWGAVLAIAYGPGSAAVQAYAGNWTLAAFVLAVSAGIAAFGAPSRRWETTLTCAMVIGFAAMAASGFSRGQTFSVIIGSVLAVVVSLTCWHRRWKAADCRVRTEELVGLTVTQASGLLGFAAGRQPDGLRDPELVAVPAAELDLSEPSLIVTSVVVDPTGPALTFGVADGAGLALGRAARGEYQRELSARVGGFPADIRPLRWPGSTGARSMSTVGGVADGSRPELQP